MSVPVEEIKPKVVEIPIASGEAVSITWPVPQPAATGMYVTKDDMLVIFLLGQMRAGEIEAFIRIFTPGTGIQILRQRMKLPAGMYQQMYWVPLTEGWITNISVNAVTETYIEDVLEVRLGLQRGWTAGEFPIVWFAAGFLDFYRGFHWPETHYVRYDRIEIIDYIDTNPGTAAYYEWINTTGYDVIIDSLYVNLRNNDSTGRFVVLDIYSNGRLMGRQVISYSISAGVTAEITWFRDHPFTATISPLWTTKFPIERPLRQYEGFRVSLYGAVSNPTFNAVRAVMRKIVR
jgi:hypothetical protein